MSGCGHDCLLGNKMVRAPGKTLMWSNGVILIEMCQEWAASKQPVGGCTEQVEQVKVERLPGEMHVLTYLGLSYQHLSYQHMKREVGTSPAYGQDENSKPTARLT